MNYKIFIVEDDLTSRMLMGKYLSRYGVCETANNGIEAIEVFTEAIKNQPFDLICLDVMMPKVDGIRTLKSIRTIEHQFRIKNGAKIIMTTALTDHSTMNEAFDNGCEAYVSKPIDLEKFNDILQELGLI